MFKGRRPASDVKIGSTANETGVPKRTVRVVEEDGGYVGVVNEQTGATAVGIVGDVKPTKLGALRELVRAKRRFEGR